MRRSFLLLLTFWLVLASVSQGYAWYNDKLDNDTCLVIESDKKIYRANLSGQITVDYFISNSCGKNLKVNFAEFVQTEFENDFNTISLLVANETKKMDYWQEVFVDGIPEMQLIEIDVPDFKEADIIKDKNKVKDFTEKEGFKLKEGYKEISIKDGNNWIKAVMQVPVGVDFEWVFTGIDVDDSTIFSVLDPFGSGAGTEADPYIVDSCGDLDDAVHNYCMDNSIFFEMNTNLDCSSEPTWSYGGCDSDTNYFMGKFNGGGYTITGIKVSTTSDNQGGLFGVVGYGGTVANLGLIDFNIWTTNNHAGVLMGQCRGCDVNEVYAYGGHVGGGGAATSYYLGGLFGAIQNTGGEEYDANVSNSYVVGTTVYGDTYQRVGGFTGSASGSSNAKTALMHNYSASGTVSAASVSGGFCGLPPTDFIDWGVYCDTETTGLADCVVGSPKTTANMKKQATFDVNGWDFTTDDGVWDIEEDTNYPTLQVFTHDVTKRDADFNLVSLAGDSFVRPMPEYAYEVDGNLTIVWTVFDYNNNRISFDLNYSDVNSSGEGSVIVNDLNLDDVVCDSAVFDVSPVTCSWDWNISGVTDGNYMIFASVNEDAWHNETIEKSDSDFNIANDVNVIVLIPIDEDTGVSVITSAIGYSLRVSDSNSTTFYDDLTEAQSITVTLGMPTSVTVDVNVSSTYYPRIYLLDFLAAQTYYSLQPYLASQADSGNFIFYVSDSTTLLPLEDIEIVVSSVVPIGGSVEIQDIYTDSAGTATIPLLLDVEYTVTFKYDDEILKTTTITPTAASLYYKTALNISDLTGTGVQTGIAYATFYPTVSYLVQRSNGSVDINFALWVRNANFSEMTVTVSDSNGCVYDTNQFSGLWTDGNYVYLHSDLNNGLATNKFSKTSCTFDSRYSVYVSVDVNFTDGNYFGFTSKHYSVVTTYEYNIAYRLMELFPSEVNKGGSLFVTSAISMFIMLISVGSMAGLGVRDPAVLGIVGVAILGFFTFLGWFALMPFAFILIATVFGIFIRSVVIG